MKPRLLPGLCALLLLLSACAPQEGAASPAPEGATPTLPPVTGSPTAGLEETLTPTAPEVTPELTPKPTISSTPEITPTPAAESPEPETPSATTSKPQDLASILAALTPGDLEPLWLPDDTSTEQLCSLLHSALACPVDGSAYQADRSGVNIFWSLDVWLSDSAQASWAPLRYFILSAGLAENQIRVWAPASGLDSLYLEDESLYQFLRTVMDLEEPDPDPSLYAPYQDVLDVCIAEYTEPFFFDAAQSNGFSLSWDITTFALSAENPDLGAQVYQVAWAYRTDPPEYAPSLEVGGCAVDSQMRIRFFVDGEPNIKTFLVLDGQGMGFYSPGLLSPEALAQYPDQEALLAALEPT